MSLRNFGIVIQGQLYRSGKYQAQHLRLAISQYGITHVIYFSETTPFLSQKTYQKLGVSFCHIPVFETQCLSDGILDTIPADKVTLIHCWKGAHRTGAIVGLLRKRMGWNPRQTWEEMCQFGFGNPAKHLELYRSVFNEGYFV